MTKKVRVIYDYDINTLSIGEAVDLLERYGSDSDPIMYKGRQMEVSDLRYNIPGDWMVRADVRAAHLRLGFWASGHEWRGRSNLWQMTLDRYDSYMADKEKEV